MAFKYRSCNCWILNFYTQSNFFFIGKTINSNPQHLRIQTLNTYTYLQLSLRKPYLSFRNDVCWGTWRTLRYICYDVRWGTDVTLWRTLRYRCYDTRLKADELLHIFHIAEMMDETDNSSVSSTSSRRTLTRIKFVKSPLFAFRLPELQPMKEKMKILFSSTLTNITILPVARVRRVSVDMSISRPLGPFVLLRPACGISCASIG